MLVLKVGGFIVAFSSLCVSGKNKKVPKAMFTLLKWAYIKLFEAGECSEGFCEFKNKDKL